MKLIIASNRQLPIRHYPEPLCQINRGIHYPTDITLPFFVEIQAADPVHAVRLYIEDVKCQYLSCEFEIYCREVAILNPLRHYFSDGIVNQQVLQISFKNK